MVNDLSSAGRSKAGGRLRAARRAPDGFGTGSTPSSPSVRSKARKRPVLMEKSSCSTIRLDAVGPSLLL